MLTWKRVESLIHKHGCRICQSSILSGRLERSTRPRAIGHTSSRLSRILNAWSTGENTSSPQMMGAYLWWSSYWNRFRLWSTRTKEHTQVTSLNTSHVLCSFCWGRHGRVCKTRLLHSVTPLWHALYNIMSFPVLEESPTTVKTNERPSRQSDTPLGTYLKPMGPANCAAYSGIYG